MMTRNSSLRKSVLPAKLIQSIFLLDLPWIEVELPLECLSMSSKYGFEFSIENGFWSEWITENERNKEIGKKWFE